MRRVLNIYRTLNALSIDVAVGACITSIFIASLLDVAISVSAILSLGISVWLIYTFDHLMDAKSIGHVPHTFRHELHQKHFKRIGVATVILGSIQLILFFYLPFQIFLMGLLLLSIVGVYFLVLWVVRTPKIYHKELLIAFVYTAGVFLPSLSTGLAAFHTYGHLLFSQIALLALTNLLIFSLVEVASDQKDQQPSLALALGAGKLKRIVHFLLFIGFTISVILLWSSIGDFRIAQYFILLMNAVLASILLIPDSWKRRDVHRIMGDAIFFIPLAYLFFAL